ncbi:MAG: aminotransferase class V-fold PLP-dependent enzyme [Bifidobacteriaceae bacterium]|nr:aminotransferase class V-fold PLP-dependent enzyme [Bifidobacteriaceae bacterium]
MINFANDYSYTAAPEILKVMLSPTHKEQARPSYGVDDVSETARDLIRHAIRQPEATIRFLAGGTQANALALDTMLPRYSSIIAPDTGHIATYEAGAIEFTGRKIQTLPNHNGTISAHQVEEYMEEFRASSLRGHMPQPGMVYISYPSELGTLYTAAELRALSQVCHDNDLLLYLDGARMAYGLAATSNDINLPLIAECCDAFCIGGTKCGAMFGEALVFSRPSTTPDHFGTSMRQHGALLAKGWLIGRQFAALFENDCHLYLHYGRLGVQRAQELQRTMKRHGAKVAVSTQTNQVFVSVSDDTKRRLAQNVTFTDWGQLNDVTNVVRFVTCWANTDADIEGLEQALIAAK